jgi:alpha/beta superfamily hydrolase
LNAFLAYSFCSFVCMVIRNTCQHHEYFIKLVIVVLEL